VDGRDVQLHRTTIADRCASLHIVAGYPTSSNRASSMHLFWEVPALDAPVVEVRATLEVFEPPRVAELWFWALQASFGAAGGAHLGLQWHPSYPGSTAANYGGYANGGGELGGGPLGHPSALGNPNTCNYAWEPGRPYVLSIRRARAGAWMGTIDDDPLRELACDDCDAGLWSPMVWTECFARCDAPPATARWSARDWSSTPPPRSSCSRARARSGSRSTRPPQCHSPGRST